MDYVERTMQLFEVMEMVKGDEKSVLTCRNEIVEINMRLVSTVLQKYKPYTKDDFQIGCIGLINAASTYDASKNVPFANYACFLIERELQMQNQVHGRSFEGQAGYMISLDEENNDKDGKEFSNRYESIADDMSEEDFNAILDDFDLNILFEDIIYPAIDKIVEAAKKSNQQVKMDIEKWKILEFRYLLEIADIETSQTKLTIAKFARDLGISAQNFRMRHQRVVNYAKRYYVEKYGCENL